MDKKELIEFDNSKTAAPFSSAIIVFSGNISKLNVNSYDPIV